MICELRIQICELRTLICELRTLICELRIQICELRTLICELRIQICELCTLNCELHFQRGEPHVHRVEVDHNLVASSKYGRQICLNLPINHSSLRGSKCSRCGRSTVHGSVAFFGATLSFKGKH